MSRSGRPPLAGGSAVTDGKQYSKLSRRGLAARRAADRAKLLANLAGDRAGGPATRSAGAPSTPSTPTSPQTRSERYALRSAEKSISKTLAESSSPDGSARYPSGAPAKLVDGDVDDDDDDEDDDDEDVDDVGTNAWSFSAASKTPIHLPWPNSSHLLWKLFFSHPPTTLRTTVSLILWSLILCWTWPYSSHLPLIL
jgi:hypothetical protein